MITAERCTETSPDYVSSKNIFPEGTRVQHINR